MYQSQRVEKWYIVIGHWRVTWYDMEHTVDWLPACRKKRVRNNTEKESKTSIPPAEPLALHQRWCILDMARSHFCHAEFKFHLHADWCSSHASLFVLIHASSMRDALATSYAELSVMAIKLIEIEPQNEGWMAPVAMRCNRSSPRPAHIDRSVDIQRLTGQWRRLGLVCLSIHRGRKIVFVW